MIDGELGYSEYSRSYGPRYAIHRFQDVPFTLLQNGRIVDGLSLFKKNVTLHFEGQVECAICYSYEYSHGSSLRWWLILGCKESSASWMQLYLESLAEHVKIGSMLGVFTKYVSFFEEPNLG
jgi:hypothetical protein